MKQLTILATLAATTLAGATNLVLNGDFEHNVAGSTQIDVDNSTYNGLMSDSTAYGMAQGIDIVTGGGYGPAAISGDWKVNLRMQGSDSLDYEEISLGLSSALVSGTSYTLTFLAAYSGQAGAVAIGISNSSTSFGNRILSVAPSTEWTRYQYTFTGESGSYLTVRALDGYMSVDDFTLSAPVPEPFTMGLAGLALAAAARRRLRKSA